MERAYVPMVKFYKRCLMAAKQNGYRYVICLLARESDIDNLYESVAKQWNSLDDLTGKEFLFLFAGKHIECDYHSDVSANSAYNNYSNHNDYLHVLNSNPELTVPYDFRSREERAHFSDELPASQTKEISDLRRHFHLTENDIPCLVFTNLYTNVNMRVKISHHNLYNYIKQLYSSLEETFRAIDTLSERINGFCKLKQSKLVSVASKIRITMKELAESINTMESKDKEALSMSVKALQYGIIRETLLKIFWHLQGILTGYQMMFL